MWQRWVKRLTIPRNSSPLTNDELRRAVKVAALGRPVGGLLLDALSSAGAYGGWCRTKHGSTAHPVWDYRGTRYIADGHIRIKLNPRASHYSLHLKRGEHRVLEGLTVYQVACLLLGHEMGHYYQALRDGRERCLQIDCDRRSLKVAKKLGLSI